MIYANRGEQRELATGMLWQAFIVLAAIKIVAIGFLLPQTTPCDDCHVDSRLHFSRAPMVPGMALRWGNRASRLRQDIPRNWRQFPYSLRVRGAGISRL